MVTVIQQKKKHRTISTHLWLLYKNVVKAIKLKEAWLVWLSGLLACEPKGRRLDSQSGHMPGLWPGWSPVGVCKTQPITSMFLSLSFSLTYPLSRNK